MNVNLLIQTGKLKGLYRTTLTGTHNAQDTTESATSCTYKFHMEDLDFLSLTRSGCSLDARIISVHLTASCSSINLSLYWLRSIKTLAISTLVKRFL